MVEYPHELTAQERAALVTERLVRGQRMSNAQVAELCGYADRTSAYYLMMRVARVLPVTYHGGVWFLDGECS